MVKWNIKKFVFSSSCATYGNPETTPIDEKHPQNPVSPYGKTKYMIEEILKDYDSAYGLKSISLRYFNAAGADTDCEIGEKHDPETHLIPLVMDAALGKRKSIKVFGSDYDTKDGTCIRDYIHVMDLAQAHILAIEKLLDGGQSDFLNLGTGHGYSVMEIIEKIKYHSGKKIPFVLTKRRDGDPSTLIASNKKAIKELGWNPVYSNIDDIVQTAWEWHNAQ